MKVYLVWDQQSESEIFVHSAHLFLLDAEKAQKRLAAEYLQGRSEEEAKATFPIQAMEVEE